MDNDMNIPDHDEREREPKPGEYTVQVFRGHVVCCRPGVKLVDFYRTEGRWVEMKEVKG